MFQADKIPLVIVSGDFPKSGIALPLGNRKVRSVALEALLLFKGKNFWSRTKIRLLQIFNFSFVWKFLFRTFDENEVFSLLRSQLSNVVFSIYVGSRKFNLPLFDAKNGTLVGHARAYFPESAEYGKNEVRILEELKRMQLKIFSFPRVLEQRQVENFFVVILSALPKGAKRMKGMRKSHLEFLKRLSEKTGNRLKFEDSNFYKEFQKEMDFLGSAIPEKKELIEYFWNTSRKNLEGKEFLFSLTKREFPFFEMLVVSNVSSSPRVLRAEGLGPKSYVVLDWEHARFGFPPIFDALSMLMSTECRKGDYIEVYTKALKNLFFKKNKKTKKYLEELIMHWHLSREDAYWFFWLYLLDQLFIHLHAGYASSGKRITYFLEQHMRNEKELWGKWMGEDLYSLEKRRFG